MSSVVLSPTSTASFPEGGGHWWVYLQYAFGLRDLGARPVWLERVHDPSGVPEALRLLERFGFDRDDVLLYEVPDRDVTTLDQLGWITGSAARAEPVIHPS